MSYTTTINGNTLIYEVSNNDKITIVGFAIHSAGVTLTIPATILHNGTVMDVVAISGFQNETSLTSVNFSGCYALTTIGTNAFYACESLEEVNFSGCVALTTIEPHAFENCGNLTSVNFSGCVALTTIGDNAFYLGATSQSQSSFTFGSAIPPEVMDGSFYRTGTAYVPSSWEGSYNHDHQGSFTIFNGSSWNGLTIEYLQTGSASGDPYFVPVL